MNLAWSDASDKQSDITALNSAYSIIFASASFYQIANAAPVYYKVANGSGSMSAYQGDISSLTAFASGESQAQGTYLQFQATPDSGYLVKSWKVNGVEVTAASADYKVTQMVGSNVQLLNISSFDTTNHVSNGALLVEVEFTNQVSTVT